MKPGPYRHIICACCTVLIFISVGLLSNVFPIYFPFIIEQRHFSNTQVSLLNTMRIMTALVSMFISDWYFEHLNLKKGIALALCASVLSYLIYGFSSSLILYYLAAAISGLGYGLGGMIPASLLIRRWFPVNAGTAMGIAAAGSGIASILGPVLITSSVNHFGLPAAFLLEAAMMAVCAVPLVFLIRNEPDTGDFENKESGKPRSASAPSEASGQKLTRGEHLRVIFGVFLIGTLGLTGFSGLSLLYTSAGHSIGTVSSLLSFMGFLLIAGKCSLGWLADRLGNRTAITLFGALLVIGQFMCCLAGSASAKFIAGTFVFLGMGLSLSTVALPIIAADFCSPGRYAALIKTYQLCYALGGLSSSTLPGIIADASGSYIPAYGLFFAFAVLSLLLIVPVYKRADMTSNTSKAA